MHRNFGEVDPQLRSRVGGLSREALNEAVGGASPPTARVRMVDLERTSPLGSGGSLVTRVCSTVDARSVAHRPSVVHSASMSSNRTQTLFLALAVAGAVAGCADRVDDTEPGAVSRLDRWLDAMEHLGELECECIFADPEAARGRSWGSSIDECVDSWLGSPVAHAPTSCTLRAFAEVDGADELVACVEDSVERVETCRTELGCVEGVGVAGECGSPGLECDFPPQLLDRVDACLR